MRDAEVIAVLSELVQERPRRGFSMCQKMIRRRQLPWNHKRVYRVYKAMQLNLRRKAKQRLATRERIPLYVPRHPDSVWSADFVSDAFACGRRYRTFNVVDDFNREAVHIEVDTSLPSSRLVRVFEQIKAERGLPDVLRTDNGPEFLGEIFVEWARQNGMAIRYIQPGKPNQNAYIERFNRTFREELLDQYLFKNLDDLREAVHWWMIEYNEQRPHGSLGDLTPLEYRQNHDRNSSLELSA